MAEAEHAWWDNVGGHAVIEGRRVALYVDRECIVCRVCSELAPAHFRLSASEDHDVCFQQPRTPDELKACEAALEECPVEAIGRDG